MKTEKILAAAVASMMMSGVAFAKGKHSKKAEKTGGTIHCAGINACKGQNSCKGQGWTELSEADCKAKGGTVVAEKAMDKADKPADKAADKAAAPADKAADKAAAPAQAK